jgi:hypothetical protein
MAKVSVESPANKPWLTEITRMDGSTGTLFKEFVFARGYFDGDVFGRVLDEGYYCMDDGDGREPEELIDACEEVYFFDSNLVAELVAKHFKVGR